MRQAVAPAQRWRENTQLFEDELRLGRVWQEWAAAELATHLRPLRVEVPDYEFREHIRDADRFSAGDCHLTIRGTAVGDVVLEVKSRPVYFADSALRVRMQVKNACGAGGSLYVGDIRVATAVPTLTLCIDDGYADQMRYAFPSFAKNSLLCSVFVVTDWQDQQESGLMADNTVAPWRDLQALDSRAWDIAPHTTGHQNALSYAEVGTIASAGTTATFSGVGTSGDNTINFVSSGALVFDKTRGLSFWAAGNETGKALLVAGSVAGVPTTETVPCATRRFRRRLWSGTPLLRSRLLPLRPLPSRFGRLTTPRIIGRSRAIREERGWEFITVHAGGLISSPPRAATIAARAVRSATGRSAASDSRR